MLRAEHAGRDETQGGAAAKGLGGEGGVGSAGDGPMRDEDLLAAIVAYQLAVAR